MPLQQELRNMLKSLKEVEQMVIAFHDEQASEYDLFLMFPRQGKNAFNDFSRELTENIGFLEAASEWKLTDAEEITEVKKALAILIDDINDLKNLEGKVSVMDGKTKKLCEDIIANLKKVLSSMEGGNEYRLGATT
ncbi:MAG: hypothetical protein ACYCQI_17115 [Gammaproteobacteria bacterium]